MARLAGMGGRRSFRVLPIDGSANTRPVGLFFTANTMALILCVFVRMHSECERKGPIVSVPWKMREI